MQIDYLILCLDTDQYAGNFERQTTAYATGRVGDCGVGDDQATEFFAETDGVSDRILDEIDKTVIDRPDDEDACRRPASIQTTPGWVNDGMGTHYRQSFDVPPTPEQVEHYRKTCRDYELPHLKNAREYTAKGIANWTQEALARKEAEYASIDAKVPRWFPAYYSVGIFLDKPLSDETLKFVCTRAEKYLTGKNINLEQVRLITVFTDKKTEVIDWKQL